MHVVNYQIAADLIDVSRYRKKNKNITFLLLIIDCFSRLVKIYPLKNKSGKVVTEAFKKYFKETPHTPRHLQVDNGLEFYNKDMTELLRSKGVNRFSIFSETKASIAE